MTHVKLKTKLVDKLTFQKLLEAHKRACRGKNDKDDVLALPYQDRVIHQWVVEEFIKPYYIPRFINDSYACIKGRGLHSAVDKIQKYMRHMKQSKGHYYIMKMDISKFFQSVDLGLLYDILKHDIADPQLLDLIYTIIFDDGEHEGLPIGNYVSQYFANIYLNQLDYYCKHNLHVKYYVRYMDDFILLAENKRQAKEWFVAVDDFVQSRLKLRLNPKSQILPCGQALQFVGYRIYENYCLITKRSKNKLSVIIADYLDGKNDYDKFIHRVQSWYGHAGHAHSYGYAKRRLEQVSQKITVAD